jgi:hypothetical protein
MGFAGLFVELLVDGGRSMMLTDDIDSAIVLVRPRPQASPVWCDERSLQVPKASPRQLESLYATPDRATRTR